MVEVRVKKDESINRALKRFKRKCDKAGIKKEIKKNLRYEKPSTRRRRQRQNLKRRLRKRKKVNFKFRAKKKSPITRGKDGVENPAFVGAMQKAGVKSKI
jgi:small subunit ribosomal protein S21